MVGTYDYWLVLLSVVVAITASYVALDLASRVVASHGRRARPYWLAGDALSISVNTVNRHRARILEKMGMRANAELIRYAVEHGLTE